MKYIAVYFFLLAFSQVKAQLYDNMWIVDNADTLFHIDFREDPPFISLKHKYIDLIRAHSVFCDEFGDLLYYTNSFQINNRLDSLLENGDSLNSGYYANINQNPIQNGSFFLPAPGDSTRCYFIYMYPEKYTGVLPLPIKVQYALIDRIANNGLGKVLEKNVPIMTGGLDVNFNHAGAVRHANGRDWWILVPNRMEPKYYRILLTPQGFSAPEEQEIGFKQPTTDPNQYFGYNLFTPDGDRYVDFEIRETGTLQFYDFDRCTGLLSNPVLIDVPPFNPLEEIHYAGIAFSPSGKRFYLCYGNMGSKIAQYDMEADDIQNSAQIIFTCPPGSNNYICGFGQPLLAPNGKIYINALVDTVAWHVIHQPNKIGATCHFESGGLKFPAKHASTEPSYYPNYRLGPLDGSACDTLGLDNHPLAGFNWEVADTLNPLLVEFTDNSFYEPTNWSWDFGGTGTSTEVNPLHDFSADGAYQVCLTVSNQYDSDTVCKLVTVSGTTAVKEVVENKLFTLHPNPTSGITHVNYQLEKGQTGELSVWDAFGKQVVLFPLDTDSGVFQLYNLPSGIYFVRLSVNGQVLQTEKLVKI